LATLIRLRNYVELSPWFQPIVDRSCGEILLHI